MTTRKVLIFGGTHGNEWTGIHIVNHYADTFKKQFPKLNIEFILANPEAHKINRRFKDEDLNRAFMFLSEDRKNSYEHNRAHELKKMIGPDDLVIDLHTTTANMGPTIILPHYTQEILGLCSKLTAKIASLHVIGAPDPKRKYLASQSQQGLIIEVGPVANGVAEARVLESTLLMLKSIFELLEEGKLPLSGSLEILEECQDVRYPLNDKGEINGYIHSAIQGRDLLAMEGEISAFKLFSGEEIKLTLTEKLFPIFVNEAAYYPQQLAFTLCRKRMLKF